MTYRVRSQRAARTRELRRSTRPKRAGVTVGEFTALLKEFYPSHGSYEKPSVGFTPNENWKPRYRPGIYDLLYAESPLVGMLTRKSADWTGGIEGAVDPHPAPVERALDFSTDEERPTVRDDVALGPAPRVCIGVNTYREYDYMDVEIPEGGRVAVAGERFTVDAKENDPFSTHEEPAASATVHTIERVEPHKRGGGYTYWIAGLNDGPESERAHMWLPYGRLYLVTD